MCTIADEKLDRNHMASYSCPFHTSNLSCMQVNVHLASLTKQEGEQRLNSSQVITWWITCCTWQGKANYPQCCIKLAGFTFVQLYCDKYRLSLQSVHFVSPFSGQGDVHGGKLWAKGRGAGVCKPTQWGTQRHDVTLPICDQVLLYRWRQDLPLGLGVEPHCQEGLELIERERVREMMLIFSFPPIFTSFFSFSFFAFCHFALWKQSYNGSRQKALLLLLFLPNCPLLPISSSSV